MDLHMLMLLGAKERTEPEFRRLLGDAGFTVQRVVRTRRPPASASSRRWPSDIKACRHSPHERRTAPGCYTSGHEC